jgi:hypothetical protein
MEEAEMITQTRARSATQRVARPEPRLRPIRTKTTVERSNAAVTSNPARVAFGRTEPTKKDIRERAYYIYLARGGANGDAVSDWLQAERELREELRRGACVGRLF